MVVAKNTQEASTKQGRVPITRAVGIQKKFYTRQLKIQRTVYSKTNRQRNPTNRAMNRCIEIAFQVLTQQDESCAESAKSPTHHESESTDRGERKTPFPVRPIERIIHIVRRLGYENDVRAALVLVTSRHYVWVKNGRGTLPSTSDTVPSVSSSSFKDRNRGVNIYKLQKILNVCADFLGRRVHISWSEWIELNKLCVGISGVGPPTKPKRG